MAFAIVNGILKKYEGTDTHVVIPETVNRIDDYAFYSAVHMESISIPETVTEMGGNVFYGCESLKEVRLPDSLSFLGSAVFSRCASLVRVIFPDLLSSLPRITFFQCENLREVQLPASLKTIGRACFEQCHSLKSLALPKGVRTIEENAFDDCTALESLVLNEGLKTIGDNAFFGCVRLKELSLPESLESIGKGAFETRGPLKLTVPDHIYIHSKMLDNNWNMYWNFGVNHRYNGKNEDNYQLHDSRIRNVNLREWKPSARIVLCVNWLETYDASPDIFAACAEENRASLLEFMVKEKRYEALNKAAQLNLISPEEIEPYLSLINDREEKAKLLEMKRKQGKQDDLFSFDPDELF